MNAISLVQRRCLRLPGGVAGTRGLIAVLRLAEKIYALFEKFRPEIPPGKKGRGASGKLDLEFIRKMAFA